MSFGNLTIIMCVLQYCYVLGNIDVSKCRETDPILTRGNFKIIGTFPIHSQDLTNINPTAILWSEVFKYTINRFNSLYTGKTLFGYLMYDTCSDDESDAVTATILDIVLDDNVTYNLGSCHCMKQNLPLYETLGIIGPHSSSNAIYMHKLLSYESLPLISYGATSMELTEYRNFYRTVPSDIYQAYFIRDVLLKYNWTYISIIATDDVYGRSGIEVLNNVLKPNGICVGVETTFNIKDKSSIKSIVYSIIKEKLSNVVILWGHLHSIKQFLKIAGAGKLHNKLWIISESAGTSQWYRDNTLIGKFLSIVPVDGRSEKFEEYFLNLTYKKLTKNSRWLKAFFQSKGVNDSYGRNSTVRDFKDSFDFSRVGFIHNAVSTLAKALIAFAKDSLSCDLTIPYCNPFPIHNHTQFNKEYINNINFKGLDGKLVQFDKDGEVKQASFDLYLTVKDLNNTVVNFEKIAQWTSTSTNTSNLTLLQRSRQQHQLTNVFSKCAEECSPGHYPIFNAVKHCCWQCVLCKDNYFKPKNGLQSCKKCPHNSIAYSNKTSCVHLTRKYLEWTEKSVLILYTLSLFGISIIATIFITFLRHRNTPIVRSSNLRLSSIQLVAHLVLFFVSPLLVIGVNSTIKCSARVCLVGFLFAVIISVSLVKVTHLLEVFNLKYKLTKREVLQQKTKEFGIIILLILIDLGIALIMLYSNGIKTTEEIHLSKYQVYLHCDEHIHYIVQVAYIILLQILCGVQSFRGRRLPGRFNEAQYSSFAMFTSILVMTVGVPLVHSMSDPNKELFVLAIIITVANLSILVILYVYKLKLIWFYPDENTVEVFQRHRMESTLLETDRKLSKVSLNLNNHSTKTQNSSIISNSTLTSVTPMVNRAFDSSGDDISLKTITELREESVVSSNNINTEEYIGVLHPVIFVKGFAYVEI